MRSEIDALGRGGCGVEFRDGSAHADDVDAAQLGIRPALGKFGVVQYPVQYSYERVSGLSRVFYDGGVVFIYVFADLDQDLNHAIRVVRTSWLMLARKRDLALSASSAALLAHRAPEMPHVSYSFVQHFTPALVAPRICSAPPARVLTSRGLQT
jgi:hypothetical protein